MLRSDPDYQALHLTHKTTSVSDCSNCIHCKLESNALLENGLPINLEKLGFLTQAHLNSNTTSKYYQALNSYLNQTNGEGGISISNAQVKKYRKLIKIQDCTTWLAMSSSSKNHYTSNGLTQSLNNNNFNGKSLRYSHSAHNYTNNKQNIANNQSFTGYKIIDPHYNYTERINLLLNRKISRSNT